MRGQGEGGIVRLGEIKPDKGGTIERVLLIACIPTLFGARQTVVPTKGESLIIV